MLGYLLRNNPSEIYRMDYSDGILSITIKKSLYDAMLEKVTREEFLSQLSFIERKEGDETLSFLIRLPFISFPNYAHKGINWEALGECSENMSLLLWLLHIYFGEKNLEESFFLSDEPQLVLIGTGYSRERDMHACPMEVGFSETISQLLAKKYQTETVIEESVREAFLVYLKLSSQTKRGFDKEIKQLVRYPGGMFDVTVKVRDSGVPQFAVPGNCACLGENPDEFRYSRDMHSHNLDSTLQQMTMLVAVVNFWNKTLKPLYRSSLLPKYSLADY